MAPVVLLDYKFRPEKGSKSRPMKCINGLQSRNSAINISERYILPYWKELSTQQLLSLFIKKKLSNKDQDMFLLMSKTNKKKSESDYKCCKLEIYKLTPSFRNSRLSSSERLCWVVWSITRSFTLIYPYPGFFHFEIPTLS